MIMILSALGGALLFRARGGLGNLPGTYLGRLCFALGYGILAATWFDNPYLLLLTVTMYAGIALGAADVIDLLRPAIPGHRWARAATRALWYTLPSGVAAYLILGLPWPSLALGGAGLAALPAYAIGWRVPLRLPGLSQGPEIGEALFGAALFVSIVSG